MDYEEEPSTRYMEDGEAEKLNEIAEYNELRYFEYLHENGE
jgi:hypothetical protein